ncbi:MAG: YggS family pyridoxal phosphate-dependent enzyme [Lachnospiraceae bacterium]|nr:YggS family pyridoxal phosphate-dependent enzyme [Lachnospiraceae bacterium]
MTKQEMTAIKSNIEEIKARIERAAIKAGRDPQDITLLAATKMNNTDRVQAAIHCGIHFCGENKVQELLDKYEQNAYEGADLQFIGTLQTNKVKYLIGKVSLIQSVGSIHLGQTISKEASKKNIVQDILIEVNIGLEEAKSGLLPQDLFSCIEELSVLPSLRIRGLMAIPPVADTDSGNTRYFQQMKQLYEELKDCDYPNVQADILSMGMTDDFEEAIACGSTMIRLGTAIFGRRNYSSGNA